MSHSSSSICELCAEFAGLLSPSARILFDTPRFVVVPTLGPLHADHLLVCTRSHLTGLHEFSDDDLREYGGLLRSLLSSMRGDAAQAICFENGTQKGSAGGCSITHFHAHIVPTLRQIGLDEIVPISSWIRAETLEECARIARLMGSYFFVANDDGTFSLAPRAGLPSQHIRRIVAAVNGVSQWDWRTLDRPREWRTERLRFDDLHRAALELTA